MEFMCQSAPGLPEVQNSETKLYSLPLWESGSISEQQVCQATLHFQNWK